MSQEQDILKNSKKRIQKLKLLSKFFQKEDLINIIIKTEVINSYFESKFIAGLDINKLELFHIQYTDSLIVLLDKIKKQKEAGILTAFQEIDANEDYIEAFVSQEKNGRDFNTERKYQNALVSDFLRSVYENLTGIKSNIGYQNIRHLSNLFALEYYRKSEKTDHLLGLPDVKYYEFESVDVERKLLGKLNVNNFRIRFICGYMINDQIFELFRIVETGEDFIWNLQTNQFYLLAEDIELLLDRSPNTSSKTSIVSDLKKRNQELKAKAEKLKTELPEEVITLLEKYKETLESQEILNQVISIDEELSILNSMLNLNLNNKIQ
ncbi:hypothetical protein [Epilithonimonas sp. UC225_85]|uniref:hypothetical protein n=1 Tax=Epilithonimonas sp. UC225_85 TaxID=3350167 RepID=UPI0036D2960C